MNIFDYNKFVKTVHQSFTDSATEQQVHDWLNLEDDYNKDSPASLGKSLSISRIKLKGKKNNLDIIDYDEPFQKGLTVWIADNGQGKSSIFKVVKYCLTGSNSIKKDVKSWLKELLLEFKIGENTFTIFIDKTSRVSEGALYSFSIDQFLLLKESGKIQGIENQELFVFKGDDALTNLMQTFFFNQFSYYSLKYTQKSSGKDDLSLKTSNLSWSTYFKTIYLESSEHEYLFLNNDYGKQGTKIFEMILGLRLTYPINRLTLMMNHVDEEIAKLKLVRESIERSSSINRPQLEKELQALNEEIKGLTSIKQNESNIKSLVDEQLDIQASINDKLASHRSIQSEYQKAISKKRKTEEEIYNFESDLKVTDIEVLRLEKQVLNMQTYRDVEGFFTNLEIKACPHCENSISEEKLEKEKHQHVCGLCGSNELTTKIDIDEINQKIESMIHDIDNYKKGIRTTELTILKLKSSLDSQEKNIQQLYGEFVKGPSVANEQERLDQISNELNRIQQERLQRKKDEEAYDLMKQKRAVLEYRIQELSKAVEMPDTRQSEISVNELKKAVFKHAIDILKRQRQDLNLELLNKLEGLILNEIQAFGLKNIARATITNDYNISFLQNGENLLFDELNESEKLRVKFAFYLSLIQLDIEYKLGRHPRFLIIDSPGSEEISKNNLHGLSSIFAQVNKRFGNELQIFIGTTLQEFSGATSPEQTFLKKTDEYIF